jgi:hypothetical protein
MSRSSSIKVGSTAALKKSIAQSYLELQRLRQLVQEVERSLASHDVFTTPSGSRINRRRRIKLNARVSLRRCAVTKLSN